MEGTQDFNYYSLGRTQLQINLCKTLTKYPSRHVKGQFLHLQCPRSKLGKFRITPYSEIVARGPNPKFSKNGHV